MTFKLFPSTSCVTLAILLSTVASGPAFAQGRAFKLEPIVLNASDEEARATKAGTETLEGEEISERVSWTLNDLFASTPGVVVSGANRPVAQDVYVRGIADTLLNVTVDGARQGGKLYAHSSSFGIDLDLLQRVVIEPGAGLALAGPGALGGGIRYETKDPEDLLLPGQTAGARLKFSAQTNGRQLAPSVSLYGVPDERFGYLVSVTKTWSDNYEDGDGNEVSSSDNEPLDALIKLRFRPTDDQQIDFASTWRQDYGNRNARSNFGIPSYLPAAATEDQEMSWRSTSVKYRFNPADNPMLDLMVTGYDTHSRLFRDIEEYRTADRYARGIDIRNRSEFGQMSLTYGYDYVWARSRGRDWEGRDKEETARNHGLYLQADYTPSSAWLLSAGLRYDSAWMADVDGNEYTGDRISPSLGVRYMPMNGIALFASYGESFRGVQPEEGMTLIWPLGLDPKNDNSLSGETARTAELGFSIDRNGWRGGISAFQSKIDGKISYWRGRRNPWYRAGDGSVESTGYNAYVGRSWDNWSVDLRYSNTKVEYNGQPVSPGDWLDGVTTGGERLTLNLGYHLPERGLKLSWTSTLVADYDDLPDSFALDHLPGYDVHDISLTWTPTERQIYTLALTNIFDKQYIDHSTPYYGVDGWSKLTEPGRSLRIQAAIRF